MDPNSAKLIVKGLLERLDADASSRFPQLTAFVSGIEREAVKALLEIPLETAVAAQPSTIQCDSEIPGTIQEPAPHAEQVRHLLSIKLDLSSLDAAVYSSSEQVVCLDFGTAKSKAFASLSREPDPDPSDLVELGLGLRDLDEDRTVYCINSSIWISDDGLMFAGAEALRQSTAPGTAGRQRKRLDSIKQELNLSNAEKNLAQRLLEPEINPTRTQLSYQDAICFFLAYLTDLTGQELVAQEHQPRFKRRFTLPCWRDAQRKWASAEIHKCLRRAQLLADTFHGRWKDGVSVDDFKAAAIQAATYDPKLMHIFDHNYQTASDSGILEPIASGSSRIWADRSARNLVLVVDVGAGTTDFSLFWVVQGTALEHRRAFPIQPCADAIRMAGDTIDDILLKKIIGAAHGDLNDANRNRIATDLRLRGLRRIKEQLFDRGTAEVSLVTDQLVRLDRQEFENCAEVKAFTRELEQRISGFLGKVHSSWNKTPGDALLVLTGGCARLPFIQALSERIWSIAGQSVRFSPTKLLPDVVASNFDSDFQREYPQLAVAMGGALPLITEKSALAEWAGGASAPGPLDRFAVTGR